MADRTRWAPLTMFRSSAEGGGQDVEVSNGALQRRFALSREAAMRLIEDADAGAPPGDGEVEQVLKDAGLIDALPLAPATRDGFSRWRERGWESSLDFYLWSRQWNFYDNGPDFEEQRDRALRIFLAEEAEPPPREARSGRTLGRPAELPATPIGEVLRRRVSSTSPKARRLPHGELAAILWYGLAPIRIAREMRPTAERVDYDYYVNLGRVYDVHLAVFDVEDLSPGLYYYDVNNNAIDLVREGNFREQMQHCLIGQSAPRTASCTVLVSTEFKRIQWVYRHDRVLRNTYINAGKIVQDMILVATAFERTTSITPAVRDTEVLSLLELDPAREQVLHTLSIG